MRRLKKWRTISSDYSQINQLKYLWIKSKCVRHSNSPGIPGHRTEQLDTEGFQDQDQKVTQCKEPVFTVSCQKRKAFIGKRCKESSRK